MKEILKPVQGAPTFKFIEQEIKYDGSQLRSLYAYMTHHILGDSVISFAGACDVSTTHMVDGEDLLAGAEIRGDRMLHFIIELFGRNLEQAVTVQRLFTLMVQESIDRFFIGRVSNGRVFDEQGFKSRLQRSGDDLYLNDGKLSISIATVSPVSALIHFAINITNAGTPVKTASLEDLQINPAELAHGVGQRFTDEMKTINEACWKVRWVP